VPLNRIINRIPALEEGAITRGNKLDAGRPSPLPSAQIQIEDLTVHPLHAEWPSHQSAGSPKKA